MYKSDPVDRRKQVQLMGRIYPGARSVMVWLGEYLAGDDEAMKIPGQMSKAKNVGGMLALASKSEMMNTHWLGLAIQFLSRPWRRRLWVEQEVARNQRRMMLCAKKVIDEESTIDAGIQADFFNLVPPAPFAGLDKDAYVKTMNNFNRLHVVRYGKFMFFADFHFLLYDCSTSDISNPSGCICGLLSLSEPEIQKGIVPDYTSSVYDMYAQITF